MADGCISYFEAISAFEAGLRVHLSARIYRVGFAAAAPLRILWANLINFLATVEAFELFVTPAWRKTEHVYPRETDLECAFESESSYSAAAGEWEMQGVDFRCHP